MTKICCTCKEDKPLDQYAFRDKKRGIRSSKCKKCHKEYVHEHYLKNKDDYIARRKRDRWKERPRAVALMNELKSSGCILCHENRTPCLDFHHINPEEKKYNISELVSLKKIKEESKKCIILCRNCHSMEHYLLRNDKPSQIK